MTSRIVVLKASPEELAKIVPKSDKPKEKARGPGRRKNPKKATDDDPVPRVTVKIPGAVLATNRALDKSGAQCRKWVKKPVNIKSFTNINFQVNAWYSADSPDIVLPTASGPSEPLVKAEA